MLTCSGCKFQQLLPSYNYCPICGKRQRWERAIVVKTDESLTEEDWNKILGLKWSARFREYLMELKENNNVPLKRSWRDRPESVNRSFVLMNLPYRFTHVGRHHKGQDFQYLYKIFKVRPKTFLD